MEQIEKFVVGKRPATRLFALALSATVILFVFNPTAYGFFPRCPLYALTGWQCAGCGTLRALHALSHGHWTEAFQLNPLLMVLLPFILFALIREIRLEAVGRHSNLNAIPAPAIWAVLFLLVGYGVLRNLISV